MKYVIAVLFLFLSISTFGQNYQAQYEELFITKNREAMPALLTKWEKADPNDPELFIAYFNYYFWESRSEMVGLSAEASDGENLALYKDGDANPSGFLNSVIVYDDSLFDLAQTYLLKGIEKYPRRLDMHFGRIFSLQEKGDYRQEIEHILTLLELHQETQDDWCWSDGEKMENPAEEISNSVQEYIYTIFNTPVPNIDGIEKVSNKMLEIYGPDVESYTNLGVCSLFKEDLFSALAHFLAAYEVDSEDAIVISNIAHTYVEMEDHAKAIEYYKILIDKGTKEDAQFAKYRIEQLENIISTTK